MEADMPNYPSEWDERRKRTSEMLRSHTMYGVRLDDMTREELYGVIGFFIKEGNPMRWSGR